METYCFDCINPIICVLDQVSATMYTHGREFREEIGWCEKCSKCKLCLEEKRQNPNFVKYRIYWTVGSHWTGLGEREITLCRDVCNEHSFVDNNCTGSQSARDFQSISYTYANIE